MLRAAQSVTVAVVLALLGLLVWKLAHNPKGIAGDVDKQKIVPAFGFTRPLVGRPGSLSLESLRGKVVVLNFWQSYCPPCTREAPVVVEASRRWASKGVVFVGVDVQDLPGPATKFMRRFGITYPNVSDGGSLVGHYGVSGYPETFFIDKRGRVIPLPANDERQLGHIIGPASAKLLDLGIRHALAQ